MMIVYLFAFVSGMPGCLLFSVSCCLWLFGVDFIVVVCEFGDCVMFSCFGGCLVW